MIIDPYKVLGIDSNATDDELKKAYRAMSKKYHPDANPDNPEAAEAKFKEVQEAYRQIVSARERGTSAYGSANGNPYGSSYGSYGNGTGGYSGQYQGGANGRGYAEYEDMFGGMFGDLFRQWQQQAYQQQQQAQNMPNELRAAVNYINNGYYREAINALLQMPENQRDAKWYYYSAYANRGVGNNATAIEHAKRAVDLEPGNQLYNQLLNQLQSGGSWYQQRGASYGNMRTGGSFCLPLCCCLPFCC